jgi:hypothetical protein
MVKLKEREFYCVGQRRKCTAPADSINIVQLRNGIHAMEAYLPRYDVYAYKFIKDNKISNMYRKYG